MIPPSFLITMEDMEGNHRSESATQASEVDGSIWDINDDEKIVTDGDYTQSRGILSNKYLRMQPSRKSNGFFLAFLIKNVSCLNEREAAIRQLFCVIK